MAENHPALAPHDPSSARPKLVTRYKSFVILESDEPLLEKLPQKQQEILRAQGSYEELAQRLQLPAGTVRSRLHRARAALTKLRTAGQDPQTAH